VFWEHSVLLTDTAPTCPPTHPPAPNPPSPPHQTPRELMAHLSIASTTARSLVGDMESLCEHTGALGKSLAAMARFEESSTVKLGQYTPGCAFGWMGVGRRVAGSGYLLQQGEGGKGRVGWVGEGG